MGAASPHLYFLRKQRNVVLFSSGTLISLYFTPKN